jgi:ribosome production factor 2
MALKRPNAISFSKKNIVRPFEDASSLDFWAQKNVASFFVVGQSTKKRPNGLVLARMFDGRVLDMCEVGVEEFVSMNQFKVGLCFRYHIILLECYVIYIYRLGCLDTKIHPRA